MVLPMKVTRNTPEQLIIADTPWLIGSFLIGFILIFVAIGLFLISESVWAGMLFALAGGGIGFGAFAAFVRRVQLILDRPSDTITLRARSLFGFSEIQHSLSNLSRAVLETTTSSKGSTLYRPTLILDSGMSTGTHPIVNAYTNTTGPRRTVTAINTWLESGPDSSPDPDPS